MPDSSLTPAQRSQSSYCYHSFLQPHIAPPVFQILLTEACLLAPAHGAELNRIMDTILRAIIKRPLTEFEVMSLIGGYENSLHSHTFVDVDSEGIFNVIMAYINGWVLYPQINLYANHTPAKQFIGPKTYSCIPIDHGAKRTGIYCNLSSKKDGDPCGWRK